MSVLRVPTRFEHILGDDRLEIPPLIVPVEADLRSFEALRRAAGTQGGGVLDFVTGPSGCGKTTAVYATASTQATNYEPVFRVSDTVPLRDLALWLEENLPSRTDKWRLVLLDGREVTDDSVGLRQLIASINQLLRRRPDLLFVWPTTDDQWLKELRDTAQRVGGDSLVPRPDIAVVGPSRELWPEVLRRILQQLDEKPDDVGLTDDYLVRAADGLTTIGAYLARIRDGIAERVEQVRLAKFLPRVLFVVTSVSAVVGEANRMRRADTYLLKGDELLAYSPRSRAGKWWDSRRGDPSHRLGYIVSLFEARLATMTPSSVVYACAEFGDEALRSAIREAGRSRSSANADRTFKNTDLYRLLTGSTRAELWSSMKGRTAATTLAAYERVQAQSRTRHKTINQSICALGERNVPSFRASLGRFEVDLGGQAAFTDAVVPLDGDDLYLEFHHLSASHVGAASMASYIMEKLQYYAIHYNLVPR